MNSCSGGLSGMDFGMANLVGVEDGGTAAAATPTVAATSLVLSDLETRDPNGSGLLKRERSASSCVETERGLKMATTDESIGPEHPERAIHQQATSLLRSNSMVSGDDGQQMLSFSSGAKTEIPFLCTSGGEGRPPRSAFPLFQQSAGCCRTAGFGYEGLSAETLGPISRFRGPFSQSQWIELEHQALIYKHIVANLPVPSNLLMPLKKSLNPYVFAGWSSGSYNPKTLGWGSFHLGFSGNTDPEPGRCRRTDGKKWRCSRDAVPDQKYCERHINRGRHRSRKPVEGQTGHAVSGSTTKLASIVSSTSATAMSSSSPSSTNIQSHCKNLQPVAADTPMSRKEGGQGMTPSAVNLKSKGSPLSIQKQHDVFQESSWSSFGLISSDCLLNPSQGNSYVNSKTCSSFLNFNDQEIHDNPEVRHFIDDWPREQSEHVTVSSPEDLKSDWTQLSMSIPIASSGFSSVSNSPRQEKLTLSSSSRICDDFDPFQMGLGVSSGDPSARGLKQANCIPISWGNSVGGPLGEVLSSTSSTIGASKNPYAVNVMTEVWDGNPQM